MTTRSRHRRLLHCAIAVVAVVGVSPAGPAVGAAPSSDPQLSLVAAATSVTVERFGAEPVWLDLGAHVVAGDRPFEVWSKRTSYRAPIVARQIVRDDAGQRAVPLPAGLVADFAGFHAFSHLTVTAEDGTVMVDRDEDFCPNGMAVRSSRTAPDLSPYPMGCPTNPFGLGSVWGIQAGWGTPLMDGDGEAGALDLPDGAYTAVVTVNQPYRKLFGMSADPLTVQVTVRTVDTGSRAGDRARAETQEDTPRAQPAAAPPTGTPTAPRGPRPDLRPLPAWWVMLMDGEAEDDSAQSRQYLAFDATVWNAGTSPLVVDGFRRAGQDVMDNYQYFYDVSGNQVGYVPVGTRAWDGRDGHGHWNFPDFVRYELLNSGKRPVQRSGKDSFCVSNTEAVDYTIPHAVWQPANGPLQSSCAIDNSPADRQVLDVGSGDMQAQFQPGQAFDITDLPNGAYYIEIRVNPDRRLHESDTTNNVSRRKVVLGGAPGARTLRVPPYEGIVG